MAEISYLIKKPKEGGVPFPPVVNLWLSSHSKNSKGHILLSCNLMSGKEVDQATDALILQLNRARKNAKKALTKARNEP